jgi:hypothetical protein
VCEPSARACSTVQKGRDSTSGAATGTPNLRTTGCPRMSRSWRSGASAGDTAAAIDGQGQRCPCWFEGLDTSGNGMASTSGLAFGFLTAPSRICCAVTWRLL